MSEIDFSKEVQINVGNGWESFEVIYIDHRWPEIIFGKRAGANTPCSYSTNDWQWRNVPPSPPEVWVVWRHWNGGVVYYGTFPSPHKLPDESFFQQKVTCEGPIW